MSSTLPSQRHLPQTDVKPPRARRRQRVPDHSSAAPPTVVNGAAPGAAPRESRMNAIAIRAHEIYEARGGQHGTALEDWLQAEREIDAVPEAT
jgi:hypothetical protein